MSWLSVVLQDIIMVVIFHSFLCLENVRNKWRYIKVNDLFKNKSFDLFENMSISYLKARNCLGFQTYNSVIL